MSYRKIHTYTKSIRKYQQERSRRKKIIELQKQGFLIRDIAAKLRVSQRTIHRDLAKLKRHIKNICNKQMQHLHNNILGIAIDNLSPSQQLEILGKLLYAKPRETLNILTNLLSKPSKTSEK